jgi:hypothetical protein
MKVRDSALCSHADQYKRFHWNQWRKLTVSEKVIDHGQDVLQRLDVVQVAQKLNKRLRILDPGLRDHVRLMHANDTTAAKSAPWPIVALAHRAPACHTGSLIAPCGRIRESCMRSKAGFETGSLVDLPYRI